MASQIQHLRKSANKVCGRGEDLGIYKVGDRVIYKTYQMFVKSKKYINGELIYELIDDDRDIWEAKEKEIKKW